VGHAAPDDTRAVDGSPGRRPAKRRAPPPQIGAPQSLPDNHRRMGDYRAGRGCNLGVTLLDHFDLHERRKLTLQVFAQGMGSARCGLIGSVKKSVFSAQFNQLLE